MDIPSFFLKHRGYNWPVRDPLEGLVENVIDLRRKHVEVPAEPVQQSRPARRVNAVWKADKENLQKARPPLQVLLTTICPSDRGLVKPNPGGSFYRQITQNSRSRIPRCDTRNPGCLLDICLMTVTIGAYRRDPDEMTAPQSHVGFQGKVVLAAINSEKTLA